MYAGTRPARDRSPRPRRPLLPPTTDLLRSAPFDRITLTDNTVLIVEPVSPRPLPTPDPAKARKNQKVRLKGSKTEIPLGGNIGLPGEPSKFKTPEQEQDEEAGRRRGQPQDQDPPARGRPTSATSR